MKIKRKIGSGFVIIAAILLLSSMVAVYEFISMRNSIAKLVDINVSSINKANSLQDIIDEYSVKLMESMADDSLPAVPDITVDDRFLSQLQSLVKIADDQQIFDNADSVKYAFVVYMQKTKAAKEIWSGSFKERRAWFVSEIIPVHAQLSGYIRNLSTVSQNLLNVDSVNLTESFYRSIMPCVVAVFSGIVLIFLFNYFINYYVLSPILRIGNGISYYLKAGRKYDVKLENDDELQELNESVAELIDNNRHLQGK